MNDILSNVVLAEQAITGTVYTDSLRTIECSGYASVLVVITDGTYTITQQVSNDGATFYDAVDTEGNAIGAVYTNINATKFIRVELIPARYTRLKVVPSVNGTLQIIMNVNKQY